MLTVGLTGNIGAGKSTVAELLVAHGAHLVDADKLAREVVEPGKPAHQALVDRFGTGILDVDGCIDRPRLAEVAFADEAVVVVDVSPEVRMERLVGQRGMSEEDVRARMAAQPSREERLEGADYVIDNSGDTGHLVGEVDRVWAELAALPQRDPVTEGSGPAT